MHIGSAVCISSYHKCIRDTRTGYSNEHGHLHTTHRTGGAIQGQPPAYTAPTRRKTYKSPHTGRPAFRRISQLRADASSNPHAAAVAST